MPHSPKTYWLRPEQSNALGPSAPHTYGRPMRLAARSTTSDADASFVKKKKDRGSAQKFLRCMVARNTRRQAVREIRVGEEGKSNANAVACFARGFLAMARVAGTGRSARVTFRGRDGRQRRAGGRNCGLRQRALKGQRSFCGGCFVLR